MKKFYAELLALFLSIATLFAVTLAWDPSPDDRVSGYAIRHGLQSSNYNMRVDVGNITQATITNLTSGITYFFVATAYTTDGLESLPSNEVSYTVPTGPPPKITYLGTRLEWWTNMAFITRQNFNLKSFTNPPDGQFYRSFLILTNRWNSPIKIVDLKTRLEWWTNMAYVNRQVFDLRSFTNPPNPQFYRSFLVITNNSF